MHCPELKKRNIDITKECDRILVTSTYVCFALKTGLLQADFLNRFVAALSLQEEEYMNIIAVKRNTALRPCSKCALTKEKRSPDLRGRMQNLNIDMLPGRVSHHSDTPANSLLMGILMVRYAALPSQGFTFPVHYPVYISDLLMNNTLLYLSEYFDYVKMLGYQELHTIMDIVCGPLNKETRIMVETYLMTENIVTQSFILENRWEGLNGFNILDEFIIINEKKEPIIGNTLMRYVCWSLEFFDNPVCILPYYGRRIESIRKDEFLKQLTSLECEVYVRGCTINGIWVSTDLVIRRTEKNIFAWDMFQTFREDKNRPCL